MNGRLGRWLRPFAAMALLLLTVLAFPPARAEAAGSSPGGPPQGPSLQGTVPQNDGGAAGSSPQNDGGAAGTLWLDTSDIDHLLQEAQAESRALPEVSVGSVLRAVTSGRGLDWHGFLRAMNQYLFSELIANTRLLGRLVALAILAAVLHNVQTAFGGGSAGKVAIMVSYLATASLALGSFALAFGTSRAVVDRLVTFMQALLPTLLALLAANGGMVTVPLLHPVMVASINIAAVSVRDVVLPLILVASLLDLVSHFSSSYKLGGVVALLRYGAVTAMGLAMVLILGVSAALKASGPVADSVALRAGKFAASTFIPIIGKMFSDAAELVAGSSHVLLSAVGVAGGVGVSLIICFPLLKLIALILTYRVAGAVIQPVSDPGVVDLLNGVANSVALAFVAVAAVALLFFLGIAILMGASNALLSLRQL